MDAIDTSQLTKSWANTNPRTSGMRHVAITEKKGSVWVKIDGAGEVAAEALYGAAPDSRVALCFTATLKVESSECHVQGNVNQGLLVVAAFYSFDRESGRTPYFAREFFHEAAA